MLILGADEPTSKFTWLAAVVPGTENVGVAGMPMLGEDTVVVVTVVLDVALLVGTEYRNGSFVLFVSIFQLPHNINFNQITTNSSPFAEKNPLKVLCCFSWLASPFLFLFSPSFPS